MVMVDKNFHIKYGKENLFIVHKDRRDKRHFLQIITVTVLLIHVGD